MRILLAGTPAMVMPIFDRIAQSDIEILGVITNPPRARGRSGKPPPTPVAIWAQEKNIKIFDSGRCDDYAEELIKADLVLIIAYGQLIPEKYLNLPRNGWVNLHFSTLPEARGAAPVQRLIAAGRKEIGYSLFKLEKGLDTGDLYFQSEQIPVTGLSTGEVWSLLVDHAARNIIEQLKAIAAGVTPKPQSEILYTGSLPVAPKISTEEARIDWNKSAEHIRNEILGFNPAPSAWTTFRGERLLIHNAQLLSEEPSGFLSPGEIYTYQKSLCVSTATGVLVITSLQSAGKRAMSGEEWLRGVSVRDRERFE